VAAEQHANPWDSSMLWAARATPVLLIFGAIDLLQDDPPVTFLVLTLGKLALGLVTLVLIHRRRRDRIALAYVAVVFLASLPHPVRGGQLLLLATLALVVTGLDVLWRSWRPASQEETDAGALDHAARE
jgi:hypothetical protein